MKIPLCFFAIGIALSATAAAEAPATPPANMHAHRKWASAAETLPERITRLEGFWAKYLPKEEGGANDRDGYEDGSHIYAIAGCAWELARAYVNAGDKEKALKILEWIQKYDSKSMLTAGVTPATK
ncbi:MAG: hypothetical protein ACAI34_22980 [Verrucomicrobium sp.]|nr:hypothetical protein [Verrucomicrobium sp.]